MAKQQTKKSPGQPAKAVRPRSPRASEAPASTGASHSPWDEAIQSLQGRSFASIDAAIEGLVDVVLDKAAASGSQREDEKKYLVSLLRTDEQVCSIVRGALKIKE